MTDKSSERQAYRAPVLVRYGDLAKLTMGGTMGSPEGMSSTSTKKN